MYTYISCVFFYLSNNNNFPVLIYDAIIVASISASSSYDYLMLVMQYAPGVCKTMSGCPKNQVSIYCTIYPILLIIKLLIV